MVRVKVLGVLVVDGGQLPTRASLREERVYEEAAEDVEGFVEVARVDVELVVGMLRRATKTYGISGAENKVEARFSRRPDTATSTTGTYKTRDLMGGTGAGHRERRPEEVRGTTSTLHHADTLGRFYVLHTRRMRDKQKVDRASCSPFAHLVARVGVGAATVAVQEGIEVALLGVLAWVTPRHEEGRRQHITHTHARAGDKEGEDGNKQEVRFLFAQPVPLQTPLPVR